jgi:hypothetical protein
MSPVIFPEHPDGNLEFIKKIDAVLLDQDLISREDPQSHQVGLRRTS